MVTDLLPACDVLVVGAGPAGIAAAIHLHWAGRTVQVIDKATFPRDKCCGDGLTALALRELERLQLRPDAVANWMDVDGAIMRSPRGREFRVPLVGDGRLAAVAPRWDLDAALVDHARQIGVPIAERVAFVDLQDHPDRVDITVRTDAGDTTIAARFVIAADGMWSRVRKATNTTLDNYRGEWHAFRQYASNVTGLASQEMMVWFDTDLLPGYAWSFPLPGDRANVGFGILRNAGRPVAEMADTWRDLLRRPHIVEALGGSVTLEDRHLAWPIPTRVDEVELAAGRTLFVGDAAAATDILTGEGIGQALETGRLAAAAIIDGGALRPEVVTDRYERSVAANLFADHRMSSRLSAIMSHERGAEAALAVVARSGSWGRRNFARWMFEDEPRSIITTPRRWHRGFLRRSGAWVGYREKR